MKINLIGLIRFLLLNARAVKHAPLMMGLIILVGIISGGSNAAHASGLADRRFMSKVLRVVFRLSVIGNNPFRGKDYSGSYIRHNYIEPSAAMRRPRVLTTIRWDTHEFVLPPCPKVLHSLRSRSQHKQLVFKPATAGVSPRLD